MRRQESIRSSARIRRIARPLISLRMADHSSAYGVQLNVPVARKNVARGFYEARSIATVPHCSGPLMLAVEVVSVSMGETVHKRRTRIRGAGSHKQMNVIGHQAVRVHGAGELLRRLLQKRKVNEVVTLLPEASHTVIAALNDMERHVGG